MRMRICAAVLAALWLAGSAVPAAGQAVAEHGPVIRQPEESDMLQDAASVVTVDPLRHQGRHDAKLFGAAGGDPAMNGLNTFLAFYVSPDQGFRIFEVGDFLAYEILSETPGRLLLRVRESVMNQAGDIGERTRRLVVTWRVPAGDEPPATVTVATAP